MGKRVSTPGMPFGTQRKLVRPFGTSLPAGSSYLNGQWSDEKIWNIPLRTALEAVGEEADRVVVLGVHHHQCAGFARGREHLEQLDIREGEVLVGHEHLERGISVVDKRRQLLTEHAWQRIGNDQMKAHVHVTFAVCLGVIVLQCLPKALPFLLQTKSPN